MTWFWDLLFGSQPVWISNLSNLTVIGVLPAIYHKVTCDARKTCPRFRWVEVPGTTYRTCRRHATQAHHQALTVKHAEKHPHAHARLNP